MKKNAFTLVEHLVVIVVLGIIMVIVGRNLTSTKREANIKEAEKIEKTLESFGPEIYIADKNEINESGEKTYYPIDFYNHGYLKSKTIKNPAGNGDCTATLTISEGPGFKAEVCCPGLYKTGEVDYKGTCD